MPDEFVPLVPRTPKSHETTFTTVGKATGNGNGAHNGNGSNGNGHGLPKGFSVSAPDDGCGKPVVTLQRNGDTITGIRVQCPCGRVLELACTY